MFSIRIFLTRQVKRYFTSNVNQRPDLNRAVSKAKKLVGYPSSSLNLRSLLNDNIPNVAVHLKDLVETNHDFLNSTTNLIYNKRNNTQAWDLIVLLISKAAGHHNANSEKEDKTDGISNNQRVLAEITEIIRAGYSIHKESLNFQPGNYSESSKVTDPRFFKNMVTILSGDYLFGYSFAEIATLRNQELIELMSTAICKLAEAEFFGRRDKQNNPLPPLPTENREGYAVREWTLLNELSGSALLAKSCQGSLKLAHHDEGIQSKGYQFGEHLAFAWQASLELNPFIGKDKSKTFSLCSAPVMFHIEYDPSILDEIDKGLESVHNVDYVKIFDIVNKGPGIELTKQLQKNHSQKAMEMLSVFDDSDAKTALLNIVAATGDFK